MQFHCCLVNVIIVHRNSLIIRTNSVINDIGDMNSRNSIIGVIPSPLGTSVPPCGVEGQDEGVYQTTSYLS